MTISISSAAEKTLALTEFEFPRLATIAKRLLAMVTLQLNSEDRTQEAIEVLSGTAASLDMREWAERYLCGMEDWNAKQYCEGHRWQS